MSTSPAPARPTRISLAVRDSNTMLRRGLLHA